MPIFLRTRKWNGEVFSEEGVNDMTALSRLAKILSIPLIALSLLLNISLGLAIFFIWRIILAVKKMADLETTGTQAIATVTRIETLETRSLGNSSRRTMPTRTMYRLVATWQHPQTGKSYTLRATIRHPDRFPIGSSVSFLVNYDNPRWHRLEDLMMDSYTNINDQPTEES